MKVKESRKDDYYYIMCGDEELEDDLKERSYETDNLYLLKIKFNSKLGREIRIKAIQEYNKKCKLKIK